jgi:hypothetical protein
MVEWAKKRNALRFVQMIVIKPGVPSHAKPLLVKVSAPMATQRGPCVDDVRTFFLAAMKKVN